MPRRSDLRAWTFLSDDLYLGFDDNDFTNNYVTIKNRYESNLLQKRKGSYSAKFATQADSIILFPERDSILKNNLSGVQNFTISFDLYPYRAGEIAQDIVSYVGFYNDELEGVKTIGFTVTIDSGTINYNFENFFTDGDGVSHTFRLTEQSPLIDRQWNTHTVVVNSASSTIKIYRNGIEQDMVFIRKGGVFNGSRLYPSPKLAEIDRMPLTIGQNGIFSLDEFVIYRDAVTNFMEHIPNKKLCFETDTFALSKNISELREIYADISLQGEYYRLGYRISDSYFPPSTELIPWVYIDPAAKQFPSSYSKGRYIQWRVEYYTPAVYSGEVFYVSDIFTRYKESSNPGTIRINNASAGDGEVKIEWRSLPNEQIESYEIYYGYAPDNYFGSAAVSPPSPIAVEAGRNSVSYDMVYTLEGLENERPYYISIRAKDIYGQYGAFSPEIMSRPSSVDNGLGYSIGR